jgi:glycosyltransferase involved in cell wall biosynthesis
MATIAVVMATYNGADWVADQLESIASQRRPPDRLIVSDDGSTDATLERVDDFRRRSAVPTTVLAGPREGLAENFWSAAAHAECDLIAWSDQDDVWHPDKLARCEAALADGGCDFVSHSAAVVNADLRGRRRRYPNYRRTVLRAPLAGDPWHVPSGFASVFRRSLLERDIDWRGRPVSHQTLRPMNHDHVVSLLAFAHCRRVELRDVLARYRQHDRNAAGDPSERGLDTVRVAMNVGAEQFTRLGEIAVRYGAFAAHGDPRVHDYFDRVAARCRRRAAIYERGTRLGALQALASAARKGVYQSRANGSFGPFALAKDVVAVTAGAS